MINSIEVSHFTKKFGDLTAVDDISFSVAEGSVFAFLGPNGAGKSTTITTLCTIQEKTSGELRINGHDVSRQKDLVRRDIGIVFQENTLDGKLTVEENLRLHCDFYGVARSDVKGRIGFVLDLVDLADWRRALVDSLSGGMKRRVEIARGLVHFPKVLFLDEPTTGLDPQTRANVWEYIRTLQHEENITIFLTTHYMEEAEICGNVAIIDHGRIVAYDTPRNLKKKFTSETMNVVVTDGVTFTNYLQANGMTYHNDGEHFTVFANGTDEVLGLVTAMRGIISDIEISKGTLNDVFLAITGKEIRQ